MVNIESSFRSTSPPQFIVLEGGDGSGKTSVRKYLFRRFAERGRVPLCLAGVAWTRVQATEVITKAKYKKIKYPENVLLQAYVDDRQAMFDSLILPALKSTDVVTDRYLMSDAVYNNLHYGISEELTIETYQKANLAQPDLVILLDTPPEVAVERLAKRGTPINHWESLEKQRHIYTAFKSLVKNNLLNWTCPIISIDNNQSIDKTLGQVAKAVFNYQADNNDAIKG